MRSQSTDGSNPLLPDHLLEIRLYVSNLCLLDLGCLYLRRWLIFHRLHWLHRRKWRFLDLSWWIRCFWVDPWRLHNIWLRSLRLQIFSIKWQSRVLGGHLMGRNLGLMNFLWMGLFLFSQRHCHAHFHFRLIFLRNFGRLYLLGWCCGWHFLFRWGEWRWWLESFLKFVWSNFSLFAVEPCWILLFVWSECIRIFLIVKIKA